MSVPLNPTSLDEELIAECLSILGKVWPAESAEGSTSSPDKAGETLPGDSDHLAFGRFRLLETRGRGGYGLVFRAHDSRLQREVALKIPRPDVLTTRATRTRFLREAQAAAALDHPNIVGVLEAAEEGKLWYIVTAYCSGPTLAEWLAEQSAPVDLRAAAALVANLADGVAHAHFRGVLHRDLKPSNVLLDPIPDSTASGLSAYSPRVADFGLAKRADAMEDETQTGTVLGTLQYMSPEQAAGRVREIGVASDIYSLGAILYEMLCGQPPHVGGSDLDLLRKVAEELPRSPRQRRPEISRDLDTVCMKCLEKSPAARYQTVVELADDLRRVLAREPVSARPLGPTHRLVRWIRRRPLVAALVGLLILVLTASSIVTATLWRQEYRQRSATQWHLTVAERRADELRRMIEQNGTILAEEIRNHPNADEIRESLLEQQVRLYEQWATADPAQPARIKHAHSVALFRLASVYAIRGQPANAANSYRQCLTLLDQLLAQDPTNLEYRYDHFYNTISLANITGTLGQIAEDERLRLQALREIQALQAEHPDNADYMDAKIVAGFQYASLLAEHDLDKARKIFKASAAEAREAIRQRPDSVAARKNLALLGYRIVKHSQTVSEREDGLAAHREAIDLLRDAIGKAGVLPELREELVQALADHAHLMLEDQDVEGALPFLEEAERQVLALRRDHPERSYLRYFEAVVWERYAHAHRSAGRDAECQAAARKAQCLLTELLAISPDHEPAKNVLQYVDEEYGTD